MSYVYCYVAVAYVCIARGFLVIHVCNQGKTLCSPCTFIYLHNNFSFCLTIKNCVFMLKSNQQALLYKYKETVH